MLSAKANKVKVLQINPEASKRDIIYHLNSLFPKIEIIDVRTAYTYKKARRFKGTISQSKSIKKAYITLKKGQDINLQPKEDKVTKDVEKT